MMASFHESSLIAYRSFDGSEHKIESDSSDEHDEDNDTEGKEQVVTAEENKCHTVLLEAIATLDRAERPKIMERSEASGKVSEFNFSRSDGNCQAVQMTELINSLAHTPSHSELKKQLSKVRTNKKALNAPLHKHDAEKVQRSVAYDAAVTEVSKWDQVVQTNRKAEHLSFPLHQPVIGLQSTNQFVKHFKPSTPLEQEVYKVLQGSKHMERPNNKLTLAEEEALASMSLEEAQERRAELQKTRALLSYYEARCHRNKKIKSKKYHRLQRKSRSKEVADKVREKIKSGPEDAQELLFDLAKARAKERMTLKHRNTGKWAKGTMRFGKYDQSAHNLLAEQLRKSHELTHKIAQVNDGDETDDVAMHSTQTSRDGGDESSATSKVSLSDINNPWLTGSIADKDQEADIQSKVVTLEPVSAPVMHEESDSDSYSSDDVIDELFEEDDCKKFTDKVKPNLVNADNPIDQNASVDNSDSFPPKSHQDTILPIRIERKEAEKDLSLTKMLTAKATGVQSASPELIMNEDQAINPTEQHLLNIQEAFAEDGIVKVFQEEKQEHIERNKPKDVDLSLPGWGEWGGSGVKPKKRKINRFLLKAKPAKPRRDENLQHALITDRRDKKIAVHQVNQLPFPYGTSEQYHRSVRAPIGSTWNTPSAVRQLTHPKVTTKMGAIIEPISAAQAFKKTRKRKTDTIQCEKQPQVATDLPFHTEKQTPKKINKQKGSRK